VPSTALPPVSPLIVTTASALSATRVVGALSTMVEPPSMKVVSTRISLNSSASVSTYV
jgi:hypothetical protein